MANFLQNIFENLHRSADRVVLREVHDDQFVSKSGAELLRLVEIALRGTDRRAREAFILQAVEGFTDDEIAAITDRKADDVRISVQAACEHLRKSPLFAAPSKQNLIARSNTA